MLLLWSCSVGMVWIHSLSQKESGMNSGSFESRVSILAPWQRREEAKHKARLLDWLDWNIKRCQEHQIYHFTNNATPHQALTPGQTLISSKTSPNASHIKSQLESRHYSRLRGQITDLWRTFGA